MKTPRVITTALRALTIGALINCSSTIGGAAEKKPGDTAAPKPELPKASPAAAPIAETPAPGAMVTREWKVPANLIQAPAPANPSVGIGDRDLAKDWLIAKGIVFNGQASAVYLASTGRLFVRNTQDQLDLVDAILSGHPVPGAAAKGKANDPVIPKLELRDVSPSVAFKAITAATGIKVIYTATRADDLRITLSLANIPASEAFRYVTDLANLKFSYEKDGVHVTDR